MTMIELAPRPSPTVPAHEWSLIDRQAHALAQSDIIPGAYRRKPANIIAAALTGRQYGWDVMTAMRNGHVIEGTWGMKPEAMLGLVRRAGHSVTGEMTDTGATVIGRRGDTGDEFRFTFTIEDGVRAGLVTLKDGKPYARSSRGSKLPWEQYPQMMCYWRAVGMLCRMLFSDVTLGVYSVEELGASVDGEGEVIDVGEVAHAPAEPQPLSDDVLAQFVQACETEGIHPDTVLAAAFVDGVPDPLTDAHLPAMRDAFRSLVGEAVGVVNAVVESPPADAIRATRAQVGKIKGEYQRVGIEDREQQLDKTTEVIGRPIESHNELTMDEAGKLIETMADWTPVGEATT